MAVYALLMQGALADFALGRLASSVGGVPAVNTSTVQKQQPLDN